VAAYTVRDPRVRLIDNPAGVTPVALNRAIEEARGTVIVRLDARAEIGPGYIAQAVQDLDSGKADCVGGAMRTLTEGSGKFAEPIRIAPDASLWSGQFAFPHGFGIVFGFEFRCAALGGCSLWRVLAPRSIRSPGPVQRASGAQSGY
jgi:hypothetical protein